MTWAWLQYSDYSAAFLVGLMGGVHCLGMCGGIVSALTFSLPAAQRQHFRQSLPIMLGYNIGRLSSYTLAGVIASSIGVAALQFTELDVLRTGLSVLAALFMVALGLYLAGLWTGIAKIEQIGKPIWKHLEPLGRRFIPINTPLKALPLGFIWGWLPCGLVYSVLLWTVSAGSVTKGALIMLLFGLGTLPNLLLMGTFAAQLQRLLRKPAIKLAAGLIVVAMGIGLLVQALT
ncbi:MAG: sulfite exporter TauE/SafE family protein [Thiofilum sp.]|uniref:sulfite exporter TauE/SafE family protein n=1 Tax=Thiofilum sp. TaxID=2212733 RepID=UPI0025DD09B7|nr:sulfite exporter TauE/SafE family protein [Thiofilum sp.]MBK8452095.1 sulfite exporter TauE/SafE family protein [Thiofilum sp.]